jgi:eukaryotic-like serine/threonine-protein kinase
MSQDEGRSALLVGRTAPLFDLPCTNPYGASRGRARSGDHRGHWVALVFYPRDFTFVCPTELIAYSAHIAQFHERDCQVLGISVDPVERHEDWLATAPEVGGVGPLRFPLAADMQGAVSRDFGVFDEQAGVAVRGLFLIDPEGTVQYQVVHNLSVGRSADETLRVLDALQSGGLCAANWTRADGTLDLSTMLDPGRVLGSYRIRRAVGQGAFGQVVEAWDETLERPVAIKVLRAGSRIDPEAVLHEARAAAALNHPGICTIHAVEQHGGVPVIVMEMLDGISLDRRLAEGPLPLRMAQRVAREIGEALAASHAAGVVHGDLKPANVMLTRNGSVKLLDFGIALRHGKRVDPPRPPVPDLASLDRTLADAPISQEVGALPTPLRGTPAYMAPEQLAGEPATPATDAFTYGLLLYELATGERAFRAADLITLVSLIETCEPQDLVARAPAEFRPVLGELLHRDPARRAPVIDALEDL